MAAKIPVSTYRLQFNAGFRFEDARALIPYLYDLGITDVYASPLLQAKRGSPHGGLPRISEALIALLLTFFLIAIPEELFFRGFLQNLLEPRMGRIGSLTLSSVVFGLTHFNKPGPFNWRYVLLATIAGIFYGRAWRDRRRILSSATTHTLVDVLWTLWFRS